MNYGQLKFRLTKAFGGVDADLIEGWIADCYQEILGLLPWSRLDVHAIRSERRTNVCTSACGHGNQRPFEPGSGIFREQW